MEDKNKIKSVLKVGIEPITILITTVLTITFGVSIGFVVNNPVLFVIFGIGFFISMSLILIQILIQQYFIREENAQIIHEKTEPIKSDTNKIVKDTGVLCNDTGCIKETTLNLNQKIKTWESVLFRKEDSKEIEARIVGLFKSNMNSKMKMKIICYGTSKYGNLVDTIKFHKNTELEIIVCSDSSPFLDSFQKDKEVLKSVIDEMSNDERITLYISKIPPTIRASLISKEVENKKEHYVWCSVQPYYIFENVGKLFRGENYSPIIVAYEKSFVMSDLKTVFDEEFERLKEASTPVPKRDDKPATEA